MPLETKKGYKNCAPEAGCLKKGLTKFFLYFVPGRNQELQRIENDPDQDFLCSDWKEKKP